MSEQRSDSPSDSTDRPPDVRYVLENQATRERIPVEVAVTVGRGSDRDVVLECVKCSRFHAEFRIEDGRLWVEDQGSTNGTYVNSEKPDGRSPLEHGDIVQFGDARFRVIDVDRQPTQPDGDKTMIAGVGDLQGLSENDPSRAPGASAADGADGDSSDRADQSSRDDSSSEGEKAPRQEPRDDLDPSIPRSWADADQLEQASHTSMLVMDEMQAPEHESPSLDPDIAISRAREHVAADCPILVGLNESVMGVMFDLSGTGEQSKWEIGRGDGADIEIDAESVSGRHCQLVHEKGRWKIVNMMSVNGTFVNERKVLSAYLQPGDVIRIGGIKIVFDNGSRKSRARRRNTTSSADGRSGIGRLFTAPFRWLGSLFSRRKS